MLTKFIDYLTSRTSPLKVGRQLRSTPRAYFDWRKEQTFQAIVKYAYKKSPFYRHKFDEFGIDPNKVKTPKDLGDFYTVPEDIMNHAEEFLCQRPHMVFESSGTTGKNKRIYFTQEELNSIGKYNAIGFYGLGLREDDRIVNAFDFCVWIPGMITHKGIETAKIFGMAAGKIDPIEVYKRIPIYNFNVVMGEPTWLIRLTELAEKHGSYPLKMILGGAEAMPEAARPWMEKVWQGAKIRMAYGTVESGGTLAFELDPVCKAYHINENNFYVEIFDPDENDFGEVTFTTLDRTTMPLIRYRNRDISRIIEEKCYCGLSYRKLEKIRGRTDEMIVASGGNLYPLMFQEILKDVPGISNDWQVIFVLEGIKEVLQFHLETQSLNGANKILEENIFDNIRRLYPDLWKNYTLGIFKVDFVYYPQGDLRKQRKLLRLVDKRHGGL